MNDRANPSVHTLPVSLHLPDALPVDGGTCETTQQIHATAVRHVLVPGGRVPESSLVPGTYALTIFSRYLDNKNSTHAGMRLLIRRCWLNADVTVIKFDALPLRTGSL
jgi:hypothetical protein